MPQIERDILYNSDPLLTAAEEERCRLDTFAPDAPSSSPNPSSNTPWLVWFHGGALTEGDKSSFETLALFLAGQGIGVALCNYRLSPLTTYPGYVEDTHLALEWVYDHHIAPQSGAAKLFIGGHSAGAYLAALVALQAHSGTPALAGAIPISGQMLTHFTVRAERGLGPNQITADEAAPIFHISPTAPPLCLLVADNDMPGRLEENRYFAAMMNVVGHSATTLHEISGRDHGSIMDQFGDSDDSVTRIVLDFIQQHS